MHLSPSSLNPLPGNLPPVQSNQGDTSLFGSLLDLVIGSSEDDFNVRGVSLVRVYTTVGTVSTAAGFLRIPSQ